MAPRQRIIIDTDPGVDDILAMLLAFASSPEELEVVLVSLTFGNVDVLNCLRNVMTLFHIIDKEQEWRRRNNRPEGFETLNAFRPIVAIGAEEPLADQLMMADFFHGRDGLGDTHSSHPHLSPSESWKSLFNHSLLSNSNPLQTATDSDLQNTFTSHTRFTPSDLPAHKQILQILRDNPSDSITIVAVGPLTNLALAAAEDVEAFLRVKEVVVMGGAIDVPGNITPLAEFNTHSDAYAFARILALTSPNPATTMPPPPPSPNTNSNPSDLPTPPYLLSYPVPLPRQLHLTLLPLDITTTHLLHATSLAHTVEPWKASGSPLAEWVLAFLGPTLERSAVSGLSGLSLHDPLAVWYAITSPDGGWAVASDQDIRVEPAGQWTRGFCVVDRRGRQKVQSYKEELVKGKEGPAVEEPVLVPVAKKGDAGGWLDVEWGNRVGLVKRSPGGVVGGGEVGGEGEFEGQMLGRVFGV